MVLNRDAIRCLNGNSTTVGTAGADLLNRAPTVRSGRGSGGYYLAGGAGNEHR